jgi:hypothetical protein
LLGPSKCHLNAQISIGIKTMKVLVQTTPH